jgi:uncharacterized membrane protein YphA (DoxX/SURF4 family)
MPELQSSAIRHARFALRFSLGFIWIYEGLVPKWLVPLTAFEKEVVAASGLVPNNVVVIDWFLHLLGFMEIALGVLVILGVRQRALCVVQAAIVGAFTIVIPITSFEILAHPFGLLSKNIPVLGAIAALWCLSAPGTANRDNESTSGKFQEDTAKIVVEARATTGPSLP